MAMIDARVIQTPHGFKVVPPDVFKHAGDEFTILNLTSSVVRVTFPTLPTDPPQGEISNGGMATFRILETPPGVYDYFVEVALNDSLRAFTLRASGNSDPHIIIDF